MKLHISLICAILISLHTYPIYAATEKPPSLKQQKMNAQNKTSTTNTSTNTTTKAATKKAKQPKFAAKRVIVKFKDGSQTANLFFNMNDTASDQSSAVVSKNWGSTKLEQIKQKYKVKKATPFFKEVTNVKGALKRMKASDKAYLSSLKSGVVQTKAQSDTKVPDLENIYIFEIQNDEDTLKAIEEFKSLPEVEYAEPDYIINKAFTDPIDTYYPLSGSWGQRYPDGQFYPDLWALKKMKVKEAWDASNSKGQGVVVAVLDTGVDVNHDDLKNNIWTNNDAPDGLDNDGNGKIDDTNGWDYAYNDKNPSDLNGHGTHIAGIIAAVENNIGIVGVAPQAKIMSVKVLDDQGFGNLTWGAWGMLYAANEGAKVINNSWGCEGCHSQFLEDNIRTATADMNAIVVFAGMNENDDVQYYGIAALPNVLSVAASTELDKKAYFSNYGHLIDVAAPGGGEIAAGVNNILSTLSSTTTQNYNGLILGTGSTNRYLRIAGTSMAAPYVTGLAALLRSVPAFAAYKEFDIRNVIMASTDDVGDAGKDSLFGFGRINALKAVQQTPRVLMGTQSVRVTDTSGNNNGYIERGENLTLTARVRNLWNVTPPNATATLSSTSSSVSVTPANLNIANLNREDERDLNFNFFVDAAASPLFSAPLKLQLASPQTPDSLKIDSILPPVNILPISSHAYYPDISGNNVVYLGNNDVSDNVYVRNLITGDITSITNDFLSKLEPRISGDYIVWSEGYPGNIKLYKISTRETVSITAGTTNNYVYPKIDGTRIVWTNDTANPKQVFWYNIPPQLPATPPTPTLVGNGFSPRISGDRVIYKRNDTQIFVKNLTTGTETQVTTSGQKIDRIDISGTKIFWTEYNSSTAEYNLKFADLSVINSTVKIAEILDIDNAYPAISGNYISWVEDWGYRGWNLFIYDLTTYTKHQIPAPAYSIPEFSTIAIDGNRIIWDTFNTTSNIYQLHLVDLNLNAAPVLDSIGAKKAGPGYAVSFILSATDPNSTDVLTYGIVESTKPAGANFYPSSGIFEWNPTLAQVRATPYVVRFTVSDGKGGTDTKEASITVIANPVPQLTPPTPLPINQSTVTFTWNNGAAEYLYLSVGTTPPNGQNTPSSDLYHSPNWSNASSATVTGIPLNGDYIYVRLMYQQNSGTNYREYAFPTTNIYPNDPPVMASIPSRTINAGTNLNFALSATDPNNSDVLTYGIVESTKPAGATFNVSTRTFSWIPTADQARETPYTVTFTVNDGHGGSDSENAIITVRSSGTGTNRPPVFTPVLPQAVVPGNTLSFTVSATDPDGDTNLTYGLADTAWSGTGVVLPTFNPSTRTFTWAPSTAQVRATPYEFTFTVTDGKTNGTASMIVPITVGSTTPTNRPPSFTVVNPQSVVIGNTATFVVSATDPDGDTNLTYSMTSPTPTPNPPAVFNASTRIFTWTPTTSQISQTPYSFTFTVTDGKTNGTATMSVPITVTAPATPTLTAPAPGTAITQSSTTFTWTKETATGFFLGVGTTQSSLEAAPYGNIYASGWRDGNFLSTVVPNIPLNGNPIYVRLWYVLNGATTFKDYTFNVTVPNRAPTFSPTIGAQSVVAGNTVTFTVSATDPDGDTNLTYSMTQPSPTPNPAASFNASTRTFTWTPTTGQVSPTAYSFTFTVSDGKANGTTTMNVPITVTSTPPANRPPSFTAVSAKSVVAGNAVTFTVSATDPDGDTNLTYSMTQPTPTPNPAASFDTSTRTFTWTPTTAQVSATAYSFTFTVTDGKTNGTATMSVLVTVTAQAPTPVLTAPAPGTAITQSSTTFTWTKEGASNFFLGVGTTQASLEAAPYGNIYASGWRDGNFLSTVVPNIPLNGNPIYVRLWYVLNGVTTFKDYTFSVGTANRAPTFTAVTAQSVVAGNTVTFTVSATDPDGDTNLTYSLTQPTPTPNPAASFNASTRTFTWTPTTGQVSATPYSFTFTVTDGKTNGTATMNVPITVTAQPVNRPPSFTPVTSKSVVSGNTLSFTVSATDPDGDTNLTYSMTPPASNPAGASFNASTRTFTWTPTTAQASPTAYSFIFNVSDGKANGTASITVPITVSANRAPTFSVVPAQSVVAGNTVTFTVLATDPDGDTNLTYSMTLPASNPSGVSFNASTRVFTWTTTSSHINAAAYNFTFTVTDGKPDGTASTVVPITVTAQSTTPVLTTPTPGSAISISSPTFAWTKENSTSFFLGVGTTQSSLEAAPYGNIYASGWRNSSFISANVPNIPLNGNTIYVRLWYVVNGITGFKDYTYTTVNQTQSITLGTPPATTTINKPVVNFNWTRSSETNFFLSVGTSSTSVANAPYGDIYASGWQASSFTSATLNIPLNGNTLYVRLWYVLNGVTSFRDYTFTRASQP